RPRPPPPPPPPPLAARGARAGPGPDRQGDITAIYTVLVAGSDMEEPVADITRGVLDGHVILDRAIAERGRFPAVDVRRSVSRSLPHCASEEENRLIALARRRIGAYEDVEPMIRTGLHVVGADPEVDAAIAVHEGLEEFVTRRSAGIEESFAMLSRALEPKGDPRNPNGQRRR
ncbi:MAG: flagellum-specific ATP synthase FliI, partial [Rubrimonas sp.]